MYTFALENIGFGVLWIVSPYKGSLYFVFQSECQTDHQGYMVARHQKQEMSNLFPRLDKTETRLRGSFSKELMQNWLLG
ncbi:hypothetical protein AQUCO_00800108v1 [Aquilegia coerulea]|uniref:Uncharacterized protein n=1 Tax=Aquilegia coerulea TaxID=218851 RepID=A0A2G5EHG6_AQUCA|nr:hypothetical protein AQUCO_00800108v1 [Aquilegia coerulea]